MNRIHESAIVGEDVVLGDGNVIGPFAVVLGPCRIGDDNWIGPHVVIGTPGETRGGAHPAAWDGDEGVGPIQIGSRNVIREFTTVQQGWAGVTRIGDDCYIMTKAHIPHDGQLGDRVTVSCSVMIGGHTVVGSGSNIGLGTVVHQKRVIGAGAMVGMGSVVTRDIPPFAMAYGSPALVRGANRVGLLRTSVDESTADTLDVMFRSGEDVTELLPDEMREFRECVERMAQAD
jgi:UDP-N-acetylglucosamine acyltransferase